MKTRVFNHRKEYNNCNNVANGICVKQVIRKVYTWKFWKSIITLICCVVWIMVGVLESIKFEFLGYVCPKKNIYSHTKSGKIASYPESRFRWTKPSSLVGWEIMQVIANLQHHQIYKRNSIPTQRKINWKTVLNMVIGKCTSSTAYLRINETNFSVQKCWQT